MRKESKIAVYIALCSIWSSTWIMIKVGLEGAPPMTAAGIRFAIASLLIFAVMLAKGIQLPRTRAFFSISLFLGFFQMALPYALIYWGEQFISSGLTAILFSTMPISVAVLARFILGDALTLPKISGIVIGVSGVVVIFSNSVDFGGRESLIGMLAVVSSAFLSSLSSVVVKKYSFRYNPFASIFLPMVIAAVFLTSSGFTMERDQPISGDPVTIASFLYLGIFGSVVAFALYFWIIKHIDVTLLSYQTFIIPLLACLLGWIFLGEKVTFKIIIGGSMIFAGIALASITKKGRPRSANGRPW